jgi:hypothetical protein
MYSPTAGCTRFDIGSFGGDGRFGRIYEETYVNKTFNTDLLLTAEKKFGLVGLTGLVGHNFFDNDETRSYLDGNTFQPAGIFNISNATVIANPAQYRTRRRTFAAYASAKADYAGLGLLGGYLRNEWASTLPEQNNSFLFPSVSAGLIITDALKAGQSRSCRTPRSGLPTPRWVTFPIPYQTQTFYVRAPPPTASATASRSRSAAATWAVPPLPTRSATPT